MNHHVVIGAGPVGSGIATLLAARGEAVTVITRSGSGPTHALITKVTADAGDAEATGVDEDYIRALRCRCASTTR